MLIGRKEFGINFASYIAFSSAAQDVASFLDLPVWPINDPSIIGRASVYSMWLAGLGLEVIAKDLAKIDGGKPQDVYETLRESIIKGISTQCCIDFIKSLPDSTCRDAAQIYDVRSRHIMIIARPKCSQVKKCTTEPELVQPESIQPELGESELTEERMLRPRAIAEAIKDDYDPQRRKEANKRLEGPVTKTEERARKKHQSKAHKDAKKRYAESQKRKVRRRVRDQEKKVEAKIRVEEKNTAEVKNTFQ